MPIMKHADEGEKYLYLLPDINKCSTTYYLGEWGTHVFEGIPDSFFPIMLYALKYK